MSFLHPLFLLGLGLLAVPVLLHLFYRKRAAIQPFPAIEFILRSAGRKAGGLKLRHLLLLLSRLLLLVLMTLGFSRPVRGPLSPEASPGPSSLAVIIDASLSMRARPGRESLFEAAKERAEGVIKGLGDKDSAALVSCGSETKVLVPLTTHREEIERALGPLEAGYGGNDLFQCVEKAVEILRASQAASQEIWLITDMRRKGWEGKKDLPPGPRLFLIDVGPGNDEDNSAVASVSVRWGDENLHIDAVLKNFTARPQDVLCRLYLGEEEKGRTLVTMGPRGQGHAVFSIPWARKGSWFGRIVIPHDALGEDDTRYFSFSSAGQIRALIVDGAPHINPYESESFYLERALNPSQVRESRVRPEVVTQSSLPTLDPYDIVFFLNIRPLPGARIQELEAFVAGGGGALFSLGENAADAAAFTKAFGGLLPLPLRGVRECPAPLHLEPTGQSGFLAGVFSGAEVRAVARAAFSKIFLLEPMVRPDSRVLIRYDDGSPALVEKKAGKGRVLLFTSTMSRRWTDLPIRPAFLPLVQEIAVHLAGMGEGQGRDVLSGEPVSLEAESVLRPDGRIIPLAGGKAPFTETSLPGIYSVRPGPGYFSVNADASESDLRRIEPEELGDSLGKNRVIFVSGRGASPPISGRTQRSRIVLWGPLLFMMMCLLPWEAFLSR